MAVKKHKTTSKRLKDTQNDYKRSKTSRQISTKRPKHSQCDRKQQQRDTEWPQRDTQPQQQGEVEGPFACLRPFLHNPPMTRAQRCRYGNPERMGKGPQTKPWLWCGCGRGQAAEVTSTVSSSSPRDSACRLTTETIEYTNTQTIDPPRHNTWKRAQRLFSAAHGFWWCFGKAWELQR